MKKMKKLLVLGLAGVMTLATAIPAFAMNAGDPGYYVKSAASAYTSPVHVRLVIDTKEEDWVDDSATSQVYDVTIASDMDGVAGVTVRDALLAWKAQSSNVTLYDYDFEDEQLLPYGADSELLYGLKIGAYSYIPSLPMSGEYAIDGLSMRINGKFPLITTSSPTWDNGPEGAYAYQTPVEEGDVIHFYWNYPYNETQTTYYSANFMSATPSYQSASNTLNVQLVKAFDYQDAYNKHWYIMPFVNSSDVPAGSYDYIIWGVGQDGSMVEVSNGEIALNSSGAGSISLGSVALASGNTYYIQIDTQSYKDCLQYDEWDDVYIVENTKVFEKFQV